MTKSIAQTIRDTSADPNKVALREAGVIDERGVVTKTGRYVLNAFLLNKHEKELVELAKAYNAEKE